METTDKKQAFLIGAPKSGTTWLANALSQNPNINLSNPKEPNIIATHKGTFPRSTNDPNWNDYEECFEGEGIRLDASIHTFACPEAPRRISERFPNPFFILSIRQPVERTFSHWRMIVDTGEAAKHGSDWSLFEDAWQDERLRCDSMYGTSIERWLKLFDLNRFFIINSLDLRKNPAKTLKEIENFLDLENFDYSLDMERHSNSSASRRPSTLIGVVMRKLFSLVPGIIKLPIVNSLQKRDINIYNAPILSRPVEKMTPASQHYSVCGQELIDELRVFSKLTSFDTSLWTSQIEENLLTAIKIENS